MSSSSAPTSWVSNETGVGLAVRKQNYKLESRTGKWKVEKHYPKTMVNIYIEYYIKPWKAELESGKLKSTPYAKFKPCLVRLLERQCSVLKLGWG